MRDTYPGSDLEIIEKALYCNEHGDTESCENWLNHLRDRLASAAPAEGRETLREMADVLFAAWAKAEPTHSITQFPESYKATFMDMARAALAIAPTKPAEGRDVKAYLYQHKQSGKTTFVTPELSRDEFEGMNPEYAYVGALVLATAPTMSEAAKAAPDFESDSKRLALELECLLLSCKDMAAVTKWFDSATEALDQHRTLLAEIERIDRAAAKGGSDAD